LEAEKEFVAQCFYRNLIVAFTCSRFKTKSKTCSHHSKILCYLSCRRSPCVL